MKTKEKKMYVGCNLHPKPEVTGRIKLELPDGCAGILFAWKSIEKGKKLEGEDTKFVEIILASKDEKGGKDV